MIIELRLLKLSAVFILAVTLSGCATPVKYGINKDLYRDNKPSQHKVLVDVFNDKRPLSERELSVNQDNKFLWTIDKNFTPDVALQASQMLAEHLRATNLFQDVKLEDIADNFIVDEKSTTLITQGGIDIVVVGDLSHFYGFQSQGAEMIAGVLFGAVGVLTDAMLNPRQVGGCVEYDNVKIIYLPQKRILWEGKIAYDFNEKDTFYDGPPVYALRAFKEANNRFSEKVASVVNAVSLSSFAYTKPETEIFEQIEETKEPLQLSLTDTSTVASEKKISIPNYSEYYRFLHKTISKAVIRPESSGIGTVSVVFTLLNGGTLEDVKVLDGSVDDQLLREAVIKAVKDSAPFPPFPEDIKKQQSENFTISLEFGYKK